MIFSSLRISIGRCFNVAVLACDAFAPKLAWSPWAAIRRQALIDVAEVFAARLQLIWVYGTIAVTQQSVGWLRRPPHGGHMDYG